MLIGPLDKKESHVRLLRGAGFGSLFISAHGAGLPASLLVVTHSGSTTAILKY